HGRRQLMAANNVVWTLELNTIAKTFAAWSILLPTITYRSLDEDELTFSVQGDLTEDCPFAYGGNVRVFRQALPAANVCVFIGTVTNIRAFGNPKDSQWNVTCQNVWFQFKRTMFQQPMAVYAGGAGCLKGQTDTTKC